MLIIVVIMVRKISFYSILLAFILGLYSATVFSSELFTEQVNKIISNVEQQNDGNPKLQAFTRSPTFSPTPFRGNLSYTEILALINFYDSFHGNSWHWENDSYGEHWDVNNPFANPCQSRWQGVVCSCIYSSDTCTLTELKLPSFGLDGTFPESFANLSQLVILNLTDNIIYGTIPDTWEPKNLISFDVASNALAGTIPNAIWSNLNLRHIRLHDNSFLGTISNHISNLRELTYFSAGYNILSGRLPYGLSSLRNLKFLLLRDNEFIGDISNVTWSNLLSLKVIDIRQNRFFGTIPSSLISLPELVSFHVGFNYFHGSLPILSSRFLEIYGVAGNNFTGTLSNSILNRQKIRIVDFSFNSIKGTIPNLPILTGLTDLLFQSNFISGTLPEGLFNQPYLERIFFDSNEINGSLPQRLNDLKYLQIFSADSNRFTGSLPFTLFHCQELYHLVVANNHLTGTIPEAIGNLTAMKWLSFSFNHFTGKIPDTIGLLTNLTNFYLTKNHFNGSLPKTIGNLENLNFLFLEFNEFTGPVPKSIADLKDLSGITLNNNFFSGQPYDAFIGFPAVLYLIMGYNLFSGPLPLNIYWRRLLFYTADYNFFSGSIPFKRAQVKYLFYADLGYNYLTGTLPKWLDENSLNYFYADHSFFHGTIPPLSRYLVELWCEGASLSGTIPESIQNCSELEVLRLNYNRLEGTIPAWISKLPNLQTLFVHSNRLSGDLSHVFLGSDPHPLIHVDVSNNALTGQLPPGLFNSTSIQSFAASSNCFSGSLPEEICSATNLVALSIDGLSTAPSCRKDIHSIPGLKSFLLKHHFVGGIPACIFALPRLQSLHVSGNQLSGKLDNSIVVSPTLVNLSISNNKFSGSIPPGIQKHTFVNLDISYNKFSGTLLAEAPVLPSNASYYAQCNRLSGSIPTNLMTATNISILDGNLFSCGMFNRVLPEHDPKYLSYSCGSNEVNWSLMIWIWTWPLFIAVVFITYQVAQRGLAKIQVRVDQREKCNTSFHAHGINMEQVETGINHHKIITTIAGDVVVKRRVENPTFSLSSFFFTSKKTATHTSTSTIQNDKLEDHLTRVPQVELANMSPFQQPNNVLSTELENEGRESHHEPQENSLLSKIRTESTTVAEIQHLYEAEDAFPRAPEVKAVASMSIIETIRHMRDRVSRWQSALVDHEAADNQQDIMSSLHIMRRICAILTTCCILLLLPIYTIISAYYSSYHYEYVWTVSALIMRGIPPAIVLMVVFCGTILLTWILIQRERSTLFEALEKDGQFSQLLFYFAFLIVDVIIMLMVNIGYVFAVDRVGPSSLIFVESAVALIKVLWNEFVVIRCFRTFKYIFYFYILGWHDSPKWYRNTLYDFVTQNAMIILNLVVLPIAAIAFASTNCLYNLVDPPPTVESGFQIEVCAITVPIGTRLICINYINSYKEISYSPPFMYSNQCSSFIVINYSSVYIYFMIIVSFVLPIAKSWLKMYTDHLPPASALRQKLLHLLPRALHVPQPAPNSYMIDKPILDKHILPIRLISYLSLLLIFGVCFPPMAFTVFVGIWIVIRFEEIVIGKLLYEADNLGYTWYRIRIREDNRQTLRYVTNPVLVWFMLSSVSLIYAYLVFDVLTDAPHVSYHDAIAPVVFIVLFPTLIFVVTIVWKLWKNQQLARQPDSNNNLPKQGNDAHCVQ